MKQKHLFLIVLAVFWAAIFRAQAQMPDDRAQKITFRFIPGNDSFYLVGNETELNRLYAFIDAHIKEITDTRTPIFVTAYSSTLANRRENLNMAHTMANRVKSELIVHKNLREEMFGTANKAEPYGTIPAAVVVEITLPELAGEKEPVVPEKKRPVQESPKTERPTVAETQPEPQSEPMAEPIDPWRDPYCFALRTNLLYDAFLLPTLGIEWRINRHVGIKVDGSLSHWGNEHGKVQKIWAVSPEVRWYLSTTKRFYVGAGGNYTDYNIYKGMVGSLFSSDTGYQGKLWNAGVTAGYQLRLSALFSLDFNLGLGYNRSEYDSFNIINDTRVYKDKDKSKNFWGPTQAGISLLWRIRK